MNNMIDSSLWNITVYLMRKYGCDTAYREISPLSWYINTGRASTEFIRQLAKAKPFMIGRMLHKGGSDDEIIKRVKEYLSKGGTK